MADECPFGDLFLVPLRNGVNYPSRTRGHGIRMVNMREIFAFDRIGDQECERAPLTDRERDVYILDRNDLLFARQSLTYEGAGKCVLVLSSQEQRTWESHLIRVRLDPTRAWPPYYYYYFRSRAGRDRMATIIQQVAAAGIRGSDLERLPVPCPTVAVQRAIADILGALDDKISINGRAHTITAELSLAIFREATVHGVRMAITNATSLISRGIAPRYVEHSGTTVLNQKCVRDQVVSLDAARLTAPLTKHHHKLLKRNDVLVNSTGQGTLGRVGRWLNNVEATVDSHITIVRFDPSVVDPVCAGYALQQMESQIEGLAEGSTGQTELRRDLLAALTLVVPQTSDQKVLAAKLTLLDDLAIQLRTESQRLTTTRDELLPLLVSGRIRVRDAEKVVEEVV